MSQIWWPTANITRAMMTTVVMTMPVGESMAFELVIDGHEPGDGEAEKRDSQHEGDAEAGDDEWAISPGDESQHSNA